jgi:glycosyltransferase involved in cell wall biosynthesis
MPKLGYLISRYPALSHTFILREVLHLRSQGLTIKVASINRPDRPVDKLDPEEREEAQKTFYVKQLDTVLKSLGFYFFLLFTSPLRVIRTLFWTCKLAGWDIKRLVKHAWYLAEAVIIARWIQSEKISHLHVHFPNPSATVALLSYQLTKTPYSISIHGPDEFYDVTLYNLREKIDQAKLLICISDYARSQLMKCSATDQWRKFFVQPLGVDTEKFKPIHVRTPSDRCQILCVGRLVPAKGQHILIQAIDLLIKNGRKVHLRLIGEGPDRENLEKEVLRKNLQNVVTFSGGVNPQDIYAAYEEADIFALASFAEGLPVVLMEAMAMELPCVSTLINGIPELIQQDVSGLLVPPSNIERLATALTCLVDDPLLRATMGKNARLRVIEKYQLAPNMRALGDVFRKIL